MLHIILHSFEDSIKLLPFLFLTYLIMEFIEHKVSQGSKNTIKKAGKFGPMVGGILGVVPQCGFSTVASNLYAGKIITVGTLLAVFLSTSDEMLPILISEAVEISLIFKILALKLVIAIFAGLAVDFFFYRKKEKDSNLHIKEMCKEEECHCEKGIFMSAVSHTLQVFFFIFAVTLVLDGIMHTVGEEALAQLIFNKPLIGCMISGLVGLIPNCASSILITQLYLSGAMGFGAMMAGLLAGAGVGVLVLFRVNKDKQENIKILFILYGIGVGVGILLEILGVR